MAIPRPGGRSARVKAAVFAAADALLTEKPPSELTMVDIAERAGVAATSLYRRWGDVGALLMEVATEQLMRDAPLPDTGSLRGDLLAWAASVSASLASRKKSTFFRVLVATADTTDPQARGTALMRRQKDIEAMLDRACARGEPTPTVGEIIDYILAPLYLRVLFGIPQRKAHVATLVGRLLR